MGTSNLLSYNFGYNLYELLLFIHVLSVKGKDNRTKRVVWKVSTKGKLSPNIKYDLKGGNGFVDQLFSLEAHHVLDH